jgi:hypothetical protein
MLPSLRFAADAYVPSPLPPAVLADAVCLLLQVTARRKKHPLDSMTVETHVTIWKSPDLIDVRWCCYC